MKKTFRRSGNSGAIAWFFHRLTAIYLAVVLLVHFAVMHFIGDGVLTYDKVAARLVSPGWKVLDILFLYTGLYHGLYGLWNLLEDYIHNAFWRAFIYFVLSFGGFALVTLGTITIVNFRG